MRHISFFFASIAFLPLPALAGDLDLRFLDQNGKPVSDVVVTVKSSGTMPRGAISFPWGTTVTQQNIAFNPGVLIVPVGAMVRFPNKDKVRHHVYSFSKPARFELKLYSQDETRSYTFTTPGAVALGCNIHDRMRGFIKVVDTPFAGKTSAAGTVRLDNVPAGTATITVWHPQLRAKDNEVVVQVPVGSSGTVARKYDLMLRAS